MLGPYTGETLLFSFKECQSQRQFHGGLCAGLKGWLQGGFLRGFSTWDFSTVQLKARKGLKLKIEIDLKAKDKWI